MDGHPANVRNLRNKKAKPKKLFKRSKPKNPSDTSPINEAQISIRDMKDSDKYDLIRIISDFRRDYYINVYKKTFQNLFTYAITGCLLAVSLSLVDMKYVSVVPPLIVTMFLIWKVSRYKRLNRNYNINEMELLNQTETIYYKFKSTESRRMNQGVLVACLKEDKPIEELDLDSLDLSDFDTDCSDFEEKLKEKNKKLVAYMIYGKQKDELETVCIKEMCVHRDYRRRKIATYFIKKASLNLFKAFGYRRVTFQTSTFNIEAEKMCHKYTSNLLTKIYSWTAYLFVPTVSDERTV